MNSKVFSIFKKVAVMAALAIFVVGASFLVSACGEHTHTFDQEGFSDWVISTPATCTTTGLRTATCSCGEVKEEVLPALGHDFECDSETLSHSCTRCDLDESCEVEIVETVLPTCTEDGYTLIRCTVCQQEVQTLKKDKLGHTWSEQYIQYQNEEGKTVHTTTCVTCRQTSPEVECTPVDAGQTVAPTCLHAGYTLLTCQVCQKEYQDNIVPALGHSYTYTWNEQTHNHTVHCSNNTSDDQDFEAACNFTEITVDAKCDAAGKTTYACPDCHGQYEVEIPALGHDWDEWEFSVSQDKSQHLHSHTCKREECLHQETITHTLNVVDSEPTCLEKGHKTYTCESEECGNYTFTEEYGEIEEHVWEAWVYSGGDTHTHYKHCTNGNHIEVADCQYSIVPTAPTCQARGYNTYTCSECQNEYQDDFVDIVSHSYGPWEEDQDVRTHTHTCIYGCNTKETLPCQFEEDRQEATCQAAGNIIYTCPDCNYSYFEELEQLQHSWGDYETDEVEHKHRRFCSVGNHYEEYSPCDVTSHTTDPTCTEEGFTLNTCNTCHKQYKSDQKDALGHDWDEWTVSTTGHTNTCKRAKCQLHLDNAKHEFVESNVCICGYDGLKYDFKSGYAYVVGYSTFDGQRIAPKTIRIRATYFGDPEHNGAEVERVGGLYSNKNLTSVVIDEGVQIVNSSAFQECTNLESVQLPTSLKYVGSNAFYGSPFVDNNPNWDEQTGMLYIDNLLIDTKNKNLTSIVVPDGTKALCSNAFFKFENLKEITLPASLKFIGSNAFFGCNNIEKVTFLGNTQDWLSIFFENEYANPLHYQNFDTQFHIQEDSDNVVLPEGITAIPAGTFRNDTSLQRIEIPETVTEIGSQAFEGCTNLATVIVHSTKIDFIGENAFEGTAFAGDDQNYTDGVLYLEVKQQEEVVCRYLIKANSEKVASNYTILPDTLVVAGGAFRNCTGLASITLSSRIETIGTHAFVGCSALKNAYFQTACNWLAWSEQGAGHFLKTSSLAADPAGSAARLTFYHTGLWQKY